MDTGTGPGVPVVVAVAQREGKAEMGKGSEGWQQLQPPRGTVLLYRVQLLSRSVSTPWSHVLPHENEEWGFNLLFILQTILSVK